MRGSSFFLFLIVIGILGGCTDDPKEKGFEVFPDMVHSVPFQPYSKNPLTADGKTMLPPVRGTIARGTEPYPYGSTEEDRAKASRELKNPVPVTAQSLARGKEVYQHMCLVCHGVSGQGDGPIIPKFPNPPSFSTKRVKELTDGALYHIITRGSGLMPPHAIQILPQDRWNLVHYVNGLRGVGKNE